jgi:ABC-type multidrug transport system ATPase subunit
LLFDIQQLAQEFRTAIIITSQHLYEMEAISKRKIVLSEGKRITPFDRTSQYFELWPEGEINDGAKLIENKLRGKPETDRPDRQRRHIHRGQLSLLHGQHRSGIERLPGVQ